MQDPTEKHFCDVGMLGKYEDNNNNNNKTYTWANWIIVTFCVYISIHIPADHYGFQQTVGDIFHLLPHGPHQRLKFQGPLSHAHGSLSHSIQNHMYGYPVKYINELFDQYTNAVYYLHESYNISIITPDSILFTQENLDNKYTYPPLCGYHVRVLPANGRLNILAHHPKAKDAYCFHHDFRLTH